MNEKSLSPLAVIGRFFIFFLLSIILLSLLDTFFYSIDVVRFTPREQVSFDVSRSLRILQLFWIWLLGIFVVGSTIIYLVSRSVLLSKIFLRLISVVTIGFAILAYWVSIQPCGGFGCSIGIGLSLLFAEASWIIAGASVPILFLSVLRRTENLLSDKKFWLTGILVLMGISILWFLTTSHLRAESAKRVSTAKSQIQNIYSDPTFPVYEPTYFPPSVGTVGHEWTANRTDSLEYIRRYHYGPTKVNNFEILETKPKAPKPNEQYFQEDLNELKAEQSRFAGYEFYKYDLEVITINGNPALIYTEHSFNKVLPILQLYVEGVRIKISMNVASEQLSKEELIRIAESLQRKN